MPVLYLHIGRGKTGTTRIQRYLAQCQAHLMEQGVHYVMADGGGAGHGHQNLAKSFVSIAPDFVIRPAQPEKIRRDVLEEILSKRLETVLISSENFAIADVPKVREYLGQLPDDYTVKIIYFVRSQDELAESEYNQIVKLKRETRPLLEYILHDITGIDYMQVAGEWEKHFGHANMICRIYDSTKDIVGQFLSCIPEVLADSLPEISASESASAANRSIGLRALAIARILNGVEIENRAELYAELFSHLTGADLPPLLLSSDAARDIREQFAASNCAFTRRYIGPPMADLGGRRYSDTERDLVRYKIKQLGLDFI